MATISTGTTALKVYNPKFMLFTPYVFNEETDQFEKGSQVYRIENIVRDTTTITQEEPEETRVDNELSADPIINNVVAGAYTFATNVGDLSSTILSTLAGFEKVNNKVFAPAGYKEVYTEIALVFETGGKYVAAVLPKVQLNATVLIESINTSVGQVAVAGVAYKETVGDRETPFYIDTNYTVPSDIAPATV